MVNNAGNQFLHFEETTRADYDSLVDIHLGGSFNVTCAAFPACARSRDTEFEWATASAALIALP